MLTLSLVCIAVFVGSIDLTVVTAVSPQILLDLGVTIEAYDHAAWIVSGYLLTYTVGLVFMGRLSDRVGRRWLYLICLAIFVVGSGLVAAATSLNGIIAGRVVQAFGAGAIVPISMALVGDLFPPHRRAPALGFVAAVETVGWMVGHLYGGILMRAFDSWRLLFWLNIPIGLLALALTWWALRDVHTSRFRGSFDWPGTLLISGSLIALSLGLSAGSELGQTDFYGEPQGLPPYALPLVGLSLVLLAAFAWVERRVRDPLLDMRLFGQRNFRIACAANVLTGFALAIALSNVTLFIHTRVGLAGLDNPDVVNLAAWDVGWILSALTLTMAGAAIPGGWLTNRLGARLPVIGGLVLAVWGFVLLSSWSPDISYLLMVAHLMLAGLGLGLVISPIATVIINAAGEQHHGSASALVITLRMVGLTIGWPVLTSWSIVRQNMLQRQGTENPLASEDPTRFLLETVTQVVNETFLFAAGACVLALLAALWMQREPIPAEPDS